MQDRQYESRVLTLPNLLSVCRVALIPLFVWLYRRETVAAWSAAVIAVCGLTDILDGILARRLHMESRLGRILDPLADKLCQAAMALMLMARFPLFAWTLGFFAVKECTLALLGYYYMRKTGIVNDARWYGKASSVVQYLAVIALILNPGIRPYSATLLIALCMAAHAVSLAFYVRFYIRSNRDPEMRRRAAMRPIDWQIFVMYLLLAGCFFLVMFTAGDSYLHDVLPRWLYVFLRMVGLIGTIGILAFFLGEKFPRRWFDARSFPFRAFRWEQDGKIYEKIGIKKWKNRAPDMSRYIQRAFPKQGSLSRDPAFIKTLLAEMCSAETVHWLLILASPVFAIMIEPWWGEIIMVGYIIGNLSSIVIQRYNRPRILKILERIEARQAANETQKEQNTCTNC